MLIINAGERLRDRLGQMAKSLGEVGITNLWQVEGIALAVYLRIKP